VIPLTWFVEPWMRRSGAAAGEPGKTAASRASAFRGLRFRGQKVELEPGRRRRSVGSALAVTAATRSIG
jgi:hypothetical protein